LLDRETTAAFLSLRTTQTEGKGMIEEKPKDLQASDSDWDFPRPEIKQRSKEKKLTRRFLQAVYQRGRNDLLPLAYFKAEAEKFCPPEEVAKLEAILQALVDEGEAKRENDAFQLLES
jgi:hypothetical protein